MHISAWPNKARKEVIRKFMHSHRSCYLYPSQKFLDGLAQITRSGFLSEQGRPPGYANTLYTMGNSLCSTYIHLWSFVPMDCSYLYRCQPRRPGFGLLELHFSDISRVSARMTLHQKSYTNVHYHLISIIVVVVIIIYFSTVRTFVNRIIAIVCDYSHRRRCINCLDAVFAISRLIRNSFIRFGLSAYEATSEAKFSDHMETNV